MRRARPTVSLKLMKIARGIFIGSTRSQGHDFAIHTWQGNERMGGHPLSYTDVIYKR